MSRREKLERLEPERSDKFGAVDDLPLFSSHTSSDKQLLGVPIVKPGRQSRGSQSHGPNTKVQRRPSIGSIFVAMPFGNDILDMVYEYIIKPTVQQKLGFECIRADERLGSYPALETIWQGIDDSLLVIAEITEHNVNVGYEVGYAHGRGKPVLFLCQSTDALPFDMRGFNVIEYGTSRRGRSGLKSVLAEHVQSML